MNIFDKFNEIDDSQSLDEQKLNEVSKRTLQDFSRIVKGKLKPEYTAVVNTETACVDICERTSGKIIGQVYPSYGTEDRDYKTLKRIRSVDEIQPGDELYVKRLTKGARKIINGIGMVKLVSGVYGSIEDAFKDK